MGLPAASVTVEDAWGNSVTKSIAVVVQDPTAQCLPDVSVPDPDEAKASPGACRSQTTQTHEQARCGLWPVTDPATDGAARRTLIRPG